MTNLKGYSIWLIPEEKTYKLLENLIQQLASRFNTPVFKPHITLIGEVNGARNEILSKSDQLSKEFKKIKIELTSVGHQDDYYRCLFFKVDENKDLLDLHIKAKTIFEKHDTHNYQPHLSIMYGHLDNAKKVELVNEVGKFLPMSFEVNCIELYSIEGKVKDWYKIKGYEIQ